MFVSLSKCLCKFMYISEQVITHRDISMFVYVNENVSMLICLTFFFCPCHVPHGT